MVFRAAVDQSVWLAVDGDGGGQYEATVVSVDKARCEVKATLPDHVRAARPTLQPLTASVAG